MSVRSTLSKRGIHLAGTNAQIHVANSELTVVSATQTAVNISGEAPLFSAENSTVQLTSTTGQRINLIGSEPTLTMKNSQLNMNASTGTGINLQGATPQVLMDNSQLLMTDTGASWGILLTGTDALFSLSNQSEVHLTGAGTGTTENIRIGANHARPELSVTGGSTLSVTTTSGTTAATDTANNAINIRGLNAQLNVIDSTLNVNIRSGNRRALLVRGDSSVGEIYDSKINLDTLNSGGMEFIGDMPNVKISGSKTEVIINSAISENAFKGNIYIGGVSNVSPGRNAELEIVENATVELNGGNFATLMINSTDAKVNIYSEASLAVNGRNNDGVNAPIRFRAGNGYQFNIDGGHFFAGKNGGNSPVIRMSGSNNKISVLNGGVFEVDNPGNGVANDGGVAGGNQGVFYPSATDIGPNTFEVKGQGSYIVIDAKSGPGIDLEGSARGQVIGSNGGYLSVSGRTATAAGGIFNANILHVVFDNPLFMDYRNNRSGGGRIFNVSNGSTLSGINSDLSLWRSGTDLNNDPTFTFDALDFEFTGSNYQNLYSTSKPEELNTSVIGTNGLSQFSRLSSNNARWVIADELHLPTDADKHIYGRISVPVGLHDSRPSWTNEVKVTVELDRVDGTKRNFSGYTVGHSDDSPGISIYGEEARGGLFEIELDDYLVEGDKVRIVELEQTNSNSDDFENINLTKTLTTVPVMPPKPASFSGSIIPNHIREIVGYSENPQVTIEANYNGNALDTTDVEVDQDGYFSIFVGDLELKEDDEIQVFLRDKKGSAESAGILKPPTTNNEQGNINPKELYEYHDAIFQPATILKVVSDISPLDPLDPEIEVEPENKPELPEEQGLLSIDFVSSFNFGSQPITVNDQTYYAQPQRLLNADGAVKETEERPNYVQISDRRPENDRNGWQLAVTQNDQFTATNNRELNGACLRLTNQQLATAQGGSAPEFQQTNPLALIPGNRRILLMAQGTEGAGTWIYRFGNQETASESVALDVPKGANPEATRYETTLTWELSAVPDN
nr:WxL domain-containing protein [Enterococcus mundtii]